jgi:hypothetical protein
MSETPRSLTIDRAAGVMTPARRGTAAGRVPCARDIRASSRLEGRGWHKSRCCCVVGSGSVFAESVRDLSCMQFLPSRAPRPQP